METMMRHERKDTIVCAFDKASPKISAYDIHEWIHKKLRLEPEEVTTIQIDGPKRQVYIKCTKPVTIEDIMTLTKGEVKYEHNTGEVSTVKIGQAGLGRRKIRIANLPPEMPA
jgi:hypothetical protein